jgi:Fe-S oxidoreductase
MGAWDTYTQMIEKTTDRFKTLNIERMVTYCGSCYNFFTNILPHVYGKKLPFEVISLYQWLWEKVEKGELKVKYPVDFKAAVCESCYISELGPEFSDTLRKLYKHIGVQILELEHHGNENLSCGMIAMARNKNFPMSFLSMWKAQHTKYKEVCKTGTNKMALNCPGCFLTLGFTNILYGKKLIYMPDELLSAFGDNITSPIQKRFPRFFISMTKRIPSWLVMKDYDQLPRIE